MKKQTLAKALIDAANLTFITQSRLRIPQALMRESVSERERDQYVLHRARQFIPEEAIKHALREYGVPLADPGSAREVLDSERGIVTALMNGQTVRASSDPFQEPDLAYLPPEDLIVRRPPTPVREPSWMATPGTTAQTSAARPQEEYVPPPDPLTQFGNLEDEEEPQHPALTQPEETRTARTQIPQTRTGQTQLGRQSAWPEPVHGEQHQHPQPNPALTQLPIASAAAPPSPPGGAVAPVQPAPVARPPLAAVPADDAALRQGLTGRQRPAARTVPPPSAALAGRAGSSQAPSVIGRGERGSLAHEHVEPHVEPGRTQRTVAPVAPVMPGGARPTGAAALVAEVADQPGTPSEESAYFARARVRAPDRPYIDPVMMNPTAGRITARSRAVMSIGEALIQLGFGDVSPEELADPKLEQTLLRAGRITEEEAMRAVALSKKMLYHDPLTSPPSPEVLPMVDEQSCQSLRVFPHSLADGGRTLRVLTDQPHRRGFIETALRERTTLDNFDLLLVTSSALDSLLREAFSTHQAARNMTQELRGTVNEVDLENSDADNNVKRYIRELIQMAVVRRASDIHFEPTDTGLRVRMRIDMKMRPVSAQAVDRALMGNVIRVLKIMCKMDVGNAREPQDARLATTIAGKRVNMRVSSLPQVDGREKVVLRVLREAEDIPEIEALNLHPDNLARLRRLLAQPQGMVLVSGPTGSGKSFTLYSALKRLSMTDINIQTLEDPVEYRLPNINQSQINDAVGYTFDRALRATMRQDPDVIFIGEIRDRTTAEVAISAANTGHLLFSTVHNLDAPSAVQRLRNLGAENYNIAPALLAVIAQRLTRRLCPHCSEPALLPPHLADALAQAGHEDAGRTRRANPTGCAQCERGRKGVIPLHEVMVVDDTLEAMITEGASVMDLRAAAMKAGMIDLMVDGAIKVSQGLIDPDDMMAAIRKEQHGNETS